MVNDVETGFIKIHPAVQLFFFVSVLAVTMTIMHPVMMGISFISALLYMIYTGKTKAMINNIRFALPTSLLVIIVNPLISHNGVTTLVYLPDGNPLTLESFFFGIAAAAMLSCIIKWFYTVNRVFTSDKIICLFGNFMPKISLLISMTLNFAEKFRIQYRRVQAVQSTLGCDTKKGRITDRLKNTIKILSIMIQWAMENSVDTADSMQSRGYGLKKRTNYSVYRIYPKDMYFLILVIVCDIVIAAAVYTNALDYSYYPYFSVGEHSIMTVMGYISFIILCTIPLTIDIMEDRKWRSIRSKI